VTARVHVKACAVIGVLDFATLCVTVCCSVLQYAAVCRNTPQYAAV